MNWTNFRLRNAVKKVKAAQALVWTLTEDEGAELVPLAAKGLPFTLPLLGAVLVVAIPEDSVVEVELGVVDDLRDGGIGVSKGPMGINTKEFSSVSVLNRPGARRGPAGGLPRAPDGTGRLAVVRPVLPKGRTAVFG